jgi:hypothetical protein
MSSWKIYAVAKQRQANVHRKKLRRKACVDKKKSETYFAAATHACMVFGMWIQPDVATSAVFIITPHARRKKKVDLAKFPGILQGVLLARRDWAASNF